MNSQAPQTALPPLDKLIKPDQLQKVVCLSPEKRAQYHEGISALWKTVNDLPEHHPDRIIAYKRLAEVSNRLRTQMAKWRHENGQGGIPTNPRPLGTATRGPGAGSLPQNPRPQGQAPSAETYSETVIAQVRALNLAIPPEMAPMSQEDRQAWAQNERRKYATLLQRYERACQQITELQTVVKTRQQAGSSFTPEEKQTITLRQSQYNHVIQDTRDQLSQFRKTHEHIREQLQAMNQGANQGIQTAGRPIPTTQTTSQVQSISSATGNTVQGTNETTNHPVPPNPTLETTGSQTNQGENQDTQLSSTLPSTQPQVTTTQPNPSLPQPTSVPGAPSQQAPMPTYPQPHQSPQPNSAHVHNPPAAYPLSHKAAVAQAQRSYSQPSIPQAAPQAHAHPNIPNESNPTNTKFPMNKTLQVTPLAPVQMGPARPTLSGGPSTGATGPMGQPGIQKHPGYILEGEGERVLSKKKLEELVRQVTGGSDGEGAEVLDPDVEEVSFQLRSSHLRVCVASG